MIELCFDFVSPYSYLAWTQARTLGARTGHAIEPRPVLFGGILDALGTKGPAEVPARRAWIIKDIVRDAHRLDVPLAMPPTHPFNPLVALRVAGLELDPELRLRAIDALFAAVWVDGTGAETPEQVAAALQRAGLEAAPLLERAAAPDAKQRLRDRTADAVARGAFGVPTLFVQGELFFGLDSFPALEAFLKGEDPVARSKGLLAQWAALRPSSVRRAKGPA